MFSVDPLASVSKLYLALPTTNVAFTACPRACSSENWHLSLSPRAGFHSEFSSKGEGGSKSDNHRIKGGTTNDTTKIQGMYMKCIYWKVDNT